jgi:hypothetical protein
MKSVDAIQRAGPEQQGAVAQLLRSVFGPGVPAALLSPELFQWKFFSPRPGSIGSRSFVLRGKEELQAHLGEWPVSFLSPSGEVPCCAFIDWVARPEAKGSGVCIFRHLMRQHGAVLTIGGSAQARRLFPKLGFQPHGAFDLFARVVRPWRQYRSRPQRASCRGIARLARNTIWSLDPAAVPEHEWKAAPISDVNAVPEGALRVQSSTFCLGVRSVSFLKYLLDCPVMNCSLFTLSKANVPRGYFLLNQHAGQCRIADLAVDSEAPQDWETAYSVAASTAAGLEATCEISAVSSLPWLSDALRRIGFRLRGQAPVVLYDPARRLANAPPLHLRMTDNDYCFSYDEHYPFLA